jgi:hypothetical protein
MPPPSNRKTSRAWRATWLARGQGDGRRPVILLAHEPDIFPKVPGRIALTLSGHTHGGQVRLFGYSPVVPSNYCNRYAYGHVSEAESTGRPGISSYRAASAARSCPSASASRRRSRS